MASLGESLMGNLKKQMSIIASFSKSYRKICDDQKTAMGISQWNEVLDDWWLSLRFFFDRAFYQGRRDDLSLSFEQATLQALDQVFGQSKNSRKRSLWELYENRFLTEENWGNQRNALRKALEREYPVKGEHIKTGKKGDRIMVRSVLSFVCQKTRSRSTPLNIVGFIKDGVRDNRVPVVAKELDSIYQVGQKIYSLLIRDVVDLFKLSVHMRPEDFKYVQAVDTWVEQLANKLGFQGTKTQLAVDLTEACRRYAVDPIAFNQGAWYLAAHSFDILTDNIERIKAPK